MRPIQLALFAIYMVNALYTLVEDYSPSNFFQKFYFFTGPDPTHGTVQYVDFATANESGLISTGEDGILLRADNTTVLTYGELRASVRLVSNRNYTYGLFLLNVTHMPFGCAVWPAFWTVGPDWPYNGEIDIIEGVNRQSMNRFSLHVGGGTCPLIISNDSFSGQLLYPDCDTYSGNQPLNSGCSIEAVSKSTYGSGFNSIGGGVYAMEWTSEGISVFFFERENIPDDIKSGRPDPSSWGTSVANFQTSCILDQFVRDHNIVFDLTFCGDWAGAAWWTDPCYQQSSFSSCQDFVLYNPNNFTDAYWLINGLTVGTLPFERGRSGYRQ